MATGGRDQLSRPTPVKCEVGCHTDEAGQEFGGHRRAERDDDGECGNLERARIDRAVVLWSSNFEPDFLYRIQSGGNGNRRSSPVVRTLRSSVFHWFQLILATCSRFGQGSPDKTGARRLRLPRLLDGILADLPSSEAANASTLVAPQH